MENQCEVPAVNPALPEEAVLVADTARRAFADLGGVELARHSEIDPRQRETIVTVISQLGLDSLDPRTDPISLAAAAASCAEAGRVALPYPLAASLVRDSGGLPTVAVPNTQVRVDHADLFPQWRVGTLDGGASFVASDAGKLSGARLGPFVGTLNDLTPAEVVTGDILCQQLLVSWTLLGALENAVSLATFHVNSRIQFGKPIATFQAVQFQLADAAVTVAGLRELAGFTLWRYSAVGEAARADVLALRLHALESARTVFRTCQQLHGAAGVCDEYDISVLIRLMQPALRLPAGVEQTAELLVDAVTLDGFVGLFPLGGE